MLILLKRDETFRSLVKQKHEQEMEKAVTTRRKRAVPMEQANNVAKESIEEGKGGKNEATVENGSANMIQNTLKGGMSQYVAFVTPILP